jgi:hypothetical protein
MVSVAMLPPVTAMLALPMICRACAVFKGTWKGVDWAGAYEPERHPA